MENEEVKQPVEIERFEDLTSRLDMELGRLRDSVSKINGMTNYLYQFGETEEAPIDSRKPTCIVNTLSDQLDILHILNDKLDMIENNLGKLMGS